MCLSTKLLKGTYIQFRLRFQMALNRMERFFANLAKKKIDIQAIKISRSAVEWNCYKRRHALNFPRLRFPFWPRLKPDSLYPDANVLNVTAN